MKKYLLMMTLALLGGVTQVKATDYIVAGDATVVNGSDSWSNTKAENKMIEVNSNQFYLIVENCELVAGANYAFKVVPNGSWSPTYPSGNYDFTVNKDGTYTIIYTFYYNADDDYTVNVVPVLNLTLSNNYNGADIWDIYNSAAVFSHVAGTNKWTLDLPASATTTDYWYFRIFKDGLLTWNSNEGKNKIIPNTNDQELTIGGNADANTWIGTDTRSWKVPYLAYPYDHYTITAEYNIAERYANNWKVSVNAYISKTVSGTYHYATLGAPTATPLDLSGLAAKGIVAYTAEANTSTKKVTLTEKTTNLAGGEGVLLYNASNDDVVLSIPVAAAGDASASNDLKTFSGTGNLMQETGYTRYILANEGGDTGFYKVNTTTGNAMGANTAYLEVTGEVASRSFLWEGETTSISAIHNAHEANGQFFNLAGQRIAQPTKGLYIVNGKKVIIK